MTPTKSLNSTSSVVFFSAPARTQEAQLQELISTSGFRPDEIGPLIRGFLDREGGVATLNKIFSDVRAKGITPNLCGVDLKCCNLSDLNLAGVNLSSANLSESILGGDLRNTQLTGAVALDTVLRANVKVDLSTNIDNMVTEPESPMLKYIAKTRYALRELTQTSFFFKRLTTSILTKPKEAEATKPKKPEATKPEETEATKPEETDGDDVDANLFEVGERLNPKKAVSVVSSFDAIKRLDNLKAKDGVVTFPHGAVLALLNQQDGVTRLNALFQKYREAGCQPSLEGIDLSDKNLGGINFTDVILDKANFSNTTCSNMIFTGASLNDANLAGMKCNIGNFVGASMKNANLDDASFEWTKFNGATMDVRAARSKFNHVEFHETRVYGNLLDGVIAYSTARPQKPLVTFSPDIHDGQVRSLSVSGLYSGAVSSTAVPKTLGQDELASLPGFTAFTLERLKADLPGCIREAAGDSRRIKSLNSALFVHRKELPTIDLTKSNFSNLSLQGLNLSGVNLTGVDLTGANLTGANLEGANLTGATLNGADLRGARLIDATLIDATLDKAKLHEALLQHANLTGAKLNGAYLIGARLADANLTNAKLCNAYLNGAQLNRAKLNVATLTGANFTQANLSYAELSTAAMSEAILTGADLTKAKLPHANLIGANLTGALLPGAILGGAKLHSANLTSANLAGAFLNGAQLNSANLTLANLTGAVLPHANLTEANLTRATLTGANLIMATLIKAKLIRANLAGAYLRKANLTQANLSGLYLAGAILWDATLTDANLTNANIAGISWDYSAEQMVALKGASQSIKTYQDHLVHLASGGADRQGDSSSVVAALGVTSESTAASPSLTTKS